MTPPTVDTKEFTIPSLRAKSEKRICAMGVDVIYFSKWIGDYAFWHRDLARLIPPISGKKTPQKRLFEFDKERLHSPITHDTMQE